MKVEVKQVLSDISYFKEVINGIRFMRNDGSWYSNFPSIVQWTSGDIVLEVQNSTICKEVAHRLNNYGITSETTSYINGVKFTAKADDDIIPVLHKALTDKQQQKKVNKTSHQLAGLAQNVDTLVEQLPFVQRGVFSRGVNALINQIETLKNIRVNQVKQNQQ